MGVAALGGLSPVAAGYFSGQSKEVKKAPDILAQYFKPPGVSEDDAPPKPVECQQSFVDNRDGRTYPIVQIGNQCWMNENLAYEIKDTQKYPRDNSGASWAKNHWGMTNPKEGGFYTWTAAMQGSTEEYAKGICPSEWHIPTDAEWTQANNDKTSRISAQLTGYRFIDGALASKGKVAQFWSSTFTFMGASAWGRFIRQGSTNLFRFGDDTSNGFSVRCVQD